jgi:pyruvate dehydrogenase E2 component (dihydrolipoamide acetyltransferase)
MMGNEFKFPDLGEGVTEGEIKKWLVKKGDTVEKDQPMAEVETDKAVVEIPSPFAGIVQELHFKEGDLVDVGEVMVTFAEGDVKGTVEKMPEEVVKAERKASVSVVGELPEGEMLLATPKVRKMAKEAGVDIAAVEGTGKGGRVTEDDLKAHMEGAKEGERKTEGKEAKEKGRPKKRPKFDMYGWVERRPLKGLRRTIARNMVESQSRTAAVTTMDIADVTDLVALREEHKRIAMEERGVKLTYMPFVMKAVVEGIREFPVLNSVVNEEEEEVVIKKYFNIGIAVATDDGLIVPVVKGVDQKSIYDLAEEVHRLAEQSKERKVDLGDLKGGTFTITNYGVFGGTYGTPVINYPEVAILGTGRIMDMPLVKDGEVMMRKVMHLSLTFDHRATDGAEAQQFLSSIIRHLENPMSILLSA